MTRRSLVTVGIPTYNRADTVVRAVESVRRQQHADLEILVSDDGSTDETREVLDAIAADDPRVRVLAQGTNVGHARNFQALLEAATGTYFMWLSDDDWLDPGYVERCLAVLEADAGHSLVAGLARYYVDGSHSVDERPTDLVDSRPGLRILRYLARVNVNGVLFGVARRDDLLEIGFHDKVGGDWSLVCQLAAKGRVQTLADVHVHRSLEGLSTDHRRLARSFGMPALLARQHHLVVAARLAWEIATAPSFKKIAPLPRATCALAACLLIVARFPGQAAARSVLKLFGLERVEDAVIAWVRRRD